MPLVSGNYAYIRVDGVSTGSFHTSGKTTLVARVGPRSSFMGHAPNSTRRTIQTRHGSSDTTIQLAHPSFSFSSRSISSVVTKRSVKSSSASLLSSQTQLSARNSHSRAHTTCQSQLVHASASTSAKTAAQHSALQQAERFSQTLRSHTRQHTST
ncbi:hypothetical protein TVAGG3_0423670, partial [Trichomonas vaginalis G3]|uniref:hypothetical protein n=1 Tax=Trichomonas vaginalis (strain ATCC PRA-98 / G3) TaxID=412133 RepID=UPI0021E5FBE2